MELTLRYYHYFKNARENLGQNLNTEESWDILRVEDGKEGAYFIPKDRGAWQQSALGNESLRQNAKDIVRLIGPEFDAVHSFGVGAAHLEFLMKREAPSMRIKCSDFAPKGVERLKNVFPEAEGITRFDMLHGDWGTVVPSGLCLLYRVDTVFDDGQWKKVLQNMANAGIEDVLFVPSDILTLKKILYLECKYAIFKLLRRKMTFSGYLRTKQRLESLLGESYRVSCIEPVGTLTGFLLKRKGIY